MRRVGGLHAFARACIGGGVGIGNPPGWSAFLAPVGVKGVGMLPRSCWWSGRLFCSEQDQREVEAPLSAATGHPDEHLNRRLKIYKPAKVSTQQGKGVMQWRAEFEKIEGADRWTNPLMGWTSTADPLSNMGIAFPTKEAAIEYANRYGYKYSVFEPEQSKENLRKFSAYGKSMVHQWRHKPPVFD
mmetsp:Transcript_4521/g.9727  ORF Transcript_4521/g.9727 Transcript_4521/m.9727 type:complete len:186 (-) Transcript_4521:276-833(-)|eukprot:CAMPEP_0185845418 /NCGR_PEP_ID=MMETSP1354-20130828/1406_1 /TAXON_ID=708628 /ORGANISM="Erythrolobus madagascarensis, Strain CCMP3276" /LENGTH=185 /DNA_ID=CAMNT_0028545381 /DNA_START=10 /DNA_END=567 /DNA_ORIENTATION=-